MPADHVLCIAFPETDMLTRSQTASSPVTLSTTAQTNDGFCCSCRTGNLPYHAVFIHFVWHAEGKLDRLSAVPLEYDETLLPSSTASFMYGC